MPFFIFPSLENSRTARDLQGCRETSKIYMYVGATHKMFQNDDYTQIY